MLLLNLVVISIMFAGFVVGFVIGVPDGFWLSLMLLCYACLYQLRSESAETRAARRLRRADWKARRLEAKRLERALPRARLLDQKNIDAEHS